MRYKMRHFTESFDLHVSVLQPLPQATLQRVISFRTIAVVLDRCVGGINYRFYLANVHVRSVTALLQTDTVRYEWRQQNKHAKTFSLELYLNQCNLSTVVHICRAPVMYMQ